MPPSPAANAGAPLYCWSLLLAGCFLPSRSIIVAPLGESARPPPVEASSSNCWSSRSASTSAAPAAIPGLHGARISSRLECSWLMGQTRSASRASASIKSSAVSPGGGGDAAAAAAAAAADVATTAPFAAAAGAAESTAARPPLLLLLPPPHSLPRSATTANPATAAAAGMVVALLGSRCRRTAW